MRFARQTAAARHLTHIALSDALQHRGCAFCHLAQQHARRALETFFQEALMDVAQRDTWRAARGLCHWHAWSAVEMPQNAGNLAILYQDVLQYDLHSLEACAPLPPRRWPWQRLRGTSWLQRLLHFWQTRPRCPLCHLWQEQEGVYGAVLLDDWQEAAFATAFVETGGLCWPHLLRLCADHAEHRHLTALLQAQRRCLSSLQQELQEFLRKQDYRFAQEPYGQEADAWQRVVALYTGGKGWPGERRAER